MQLELDTNIENVDILTEATNEVLADLGCPKKSVIQIDIALDELFSNISHYAYGGAVGKAYVCVEALPNNGGVSITLEDEGVPFDPLSHEDPDVTLGVQERSIGGLGIFLVRRTMDDMYYEYADGRNKLTIVKRF
ncbi:MAG: ATP-binding protein [Atopobiaceae bacterium]|nr:ATP-binding protein [Atopobiaceae bacterium]